MRKHIITPDKDGAKRSKSLAVILPSEIVKQCHIDTTIVFVVSTYSNGIMLYYLDVPVDCNPVPLTGIDY